MNKTFLAWIVVGGAAAALVGCATKPTDAGDVKSSSGKRCCRKQSLSRHWNVLNSPCETRYAGQVE